MIAALGTLAFLITLWLLIVVGAAILEESGEKIVAALKGETAPLFSSPAPLRLRARPRPAIPIRANARWRAAA